MHRNAREWRHGGAIYSSALSREEEKVAEVSFHNNIIGNFMVYQDRLETNLYSYLGTRKIQNQFL